MMDRKYVLGLLLGFAAVPADAQQPVIRRYDEPPIAPPVIRRDDRPLATDPVISRDGGPATYPIIRRDDSVEAGQPVIRRDDQPPVAQPAIRRGNQPTATEMPVWTPARSRATPQAVVQVPPAPAGTPSPCPTPGGDPCQQYYNGCPQPTYAPAACPPTACVPTTCPPADCAPPKRGHPILDRLRADPCSKEREVWFGGEYLLWHISRGLVNGPLAADPATQARLGGDIDYGLLQGGRVSGGAWWGRDCDTLHGFELSAFLLPRKTAGYVLAPPPGGGLVRPFTDLTTLTTGAAVVALPGVATGRLAVDSSTKLWGSDALFVLRVDEGRGVYFDLLGGVRYLDLDEDLTLSQSSTLAGPGAGAFAGTPLRGATLGVTDVYRTSNRFVGGELGNRFGVRANRLSFEMYGKVALGWVRETVDTGGATVLSGVGPTAVVPGGLLVVPQTAGHRTVDDFAVVPEFGATVGYNVTRWLRLSAGYSALYWNRLTRPGDQITTTINPTLVPSSPTFNPAGGGTALAAPVTRNHLWVNGISFGATFTY
jgi:hypothetical protein